MDEYEVVQCLEFCIGLSDALLPDPTVKAKGLAVASVEGGRGTGVKQPAGTARTTKAR